MEYRIAQDEPMTNEELVQAARAGDKTALEELVKRI